MQPIGLVRLVVAATLGLVAAPALADSATLGNILDVPVTYQTGVPDAQGYVAWESYTIKPCETHEWSWDQAGPPNLHMLSPLYADQRKDEYGNVIMSRFVMPMTPQGGLIVFFPFGDQIWLDMSGAANMDKCKQAAQTPAAPVMEPEVSVATNTPQQTSTPNIEALLNGPPSVWGLIYVDLTSTGGQQRALLGLDDLFARAERGEILLIDMGGIYDGMAPSHIVPYDTAQVVQALLLDMLSDDTYSEEEFKDQLAAYVIQSQALVAQLRRNRDALLGAKN